MAKTKYGHLIVREPFNNNDAFPPFHKMMLYYSSDVTDEVGFSLRYTYVNKAGQVESSHKHNHAQFLCFLGTPDNIEEFPAEIEFFWARKWKSILLVVPQSSMFRQTCIMLRSFLRESINQLCS